jgi:uncharacterized membrane protein
MRALWILAALVACNRSDGTGPVGDDDGSLTETSDTGSMADPCESAPVVTWENFGAGFVTENCQVCHASTSTSRNGAPIDVVFDTEQDTLDFAERFMSRVVDSESMPPQGGVTANDRYFVSVWLGCD